MVPMGAGWGGHTRAQHFAHVDQLEGVLGHLCGEIVTDLHAGIHLAEDAGVAGLGTQMMIGTGAGKRIGVAHRGRTRWSNCG